MKPERGGFTMIELLVSISIMAIMIAVLMPAVSAVRKNAKETQQRSQMTKIDMALLAFKADRGNYPPSAWRDENDDYYCGAERLAEALVGQDLMGFHSWSSFRSDGWGKDPQGNPVDLYPDTLDPSNQADQKNLKLRKGPYLDLTTSNAFELDKVFDGKTGLLGKDQKHYLICDVFKVKSLIINKERFKAGTPILYYRANTASKRMDRRGNQAEENIYDHRDNLSLISLKKLPDLKKNHKLYSPTFFYNDWEDDEPYYIIDPKASTSTLKWPHRADSYILISAGYDGEYGTQDDIFNF